MSGNNQAVFAIYNDDSRLQEAVRGLCACGFRPSDISVLRAENPGSREFAHERHSKAPEGAASGGILGAILGAVLGWFLGTGDLPFAAPPLFEATGPVISMLSGVGAGLVSGGVIGGLVGWGQPVYETKCLASNPGRQKHPAFGPLWRTRSDR